MAGPSRSITRNLHRSIPSQRLNVYRCFLRPQSSITSSQRGAQTIPSQTRCRRRRQTTHAPSQTRTYYSSSEAQTPPHPPEETAILSAALARVPAHGFTMEALTLGATDAGYLAASTNLFPRGVFDLVMFHLVNERLALKDRVQFPVSEDAPLQQDTAKSQAQREANLNALILARLHANKPILPRLSEALAVISLPPNIPTSLAELARLADEILYLSGDTSVDSSWYTKRAGVSGVYAASELFMTQDSSLEFKDTEEFVRRRLDEMHSLGATVGDVGEWLKFSGMGAVNVLRSWGVKI